MSKEHAQQAIKAAYRDLRIYYFLSYWLSLVGIFEGCVAMAFGLSDLMWAAFITAGASYLYFTDRGDKAHPRDYMPS